MKSCPTCQSTYPDDFSLCPRDGAHLTVQATETEAQLAAGLSRRFRLVRRLGKGGMGTVFLAEQIGVGNRPVALKVLNRKLLDDPDFLLRFQNEAGSTGRIHHPNVVSIYESAQSDDGTPYIAMEFLEGESLREVLKRRGALPLTEVAEILQQAAGGLTAAHKLGIIHRDLKPDNIFLTHTDEGGLIVKVVDFGIAKLRESAMHTQTGTVLGTPAYMSFEQASGMRSDELDARSDIYSLGVVVYEMLTGRTPFHSDTPVGYLRKHLMEEPPPLRAVKPGLPVPPRIESVVMKALTKDRNHRYTSMLEFAQEFAQAAETGSHLAAQPKPQQEVAKPQPQTTVTPVAKTSFPAAVQDTVAAKAVPETARPSRRKWLIVGSLIFLILAAAGGFWLYTSYRQRRDFTKETRDAQATSSQDTYVITAHTSVPAGSYSNLRDELYTIVHGAETLKVRYSNSQTSSARPGDFPGTGLHMHSSYSNPDLSQIPAAGVAIRACLMSKDRTEDGGPIIDTQPTPAPCMARIGNVLQYEPSPNAGNFTYVAFDILAETTGQ
jgi:serine/threonine protein kinase